MSSANDLFVVIEPFETIVQPGISERRYRFKVLQDPNAHEDIDLFLLAQEAHRAIDETQKSLTPGQQPSITVIVKNPCIAMRYPLQEGQVRRFQVRLCKEEDFYETLKVFAITKVPFIEAGTVPKHLPPTAEPARPMVVNNQISGFVPQNSQEPRNVYREAQGRPFVMANTASQACPSNGVITPSQPLFQSRISTYQSDQISDDNPSRRVTATNASIFQSTNSTGPNISFASQGSQTVQPVESSISTYIQRPSTAPVAMKPSGASDLPPKRDLPFGRKTKLIPALEVGKIVEVGEGLGQTAVDTRSTTTHTFETVSKEDIECLADAGKKKRALSKPKKILATKRPKASASRKKPATDRSQAVEQEPNVNQPTESNENLSAASVDSASNIDTQALLDRAEEVQAMRQTRSMARSAKSSVALAQNQQAPKNNQIGGSSCQRNAATRPWEQPEQQTVSTPTEPPSKPHKPKTKVFSNRNKHVKQSGNHPHDSNRSGQQSSSKNISTNSQENNQDQDQHNASAGEAQSTGNLQQPLETLSDPQTSALAALLVDPNFAQPAIPQFLANGSTTTTNFNDLPEQAKREAVESWIIEVIDKPEFLSLVRLLGGVWQGMFVKI